VLAPDAPGFLVNHAGRGLVTEALQILAESVAEPADVDRIAREALGLKMGPFELLDLTGLDVSHPVLESIWNGFYGDPRFRPSHLTRTRVDAGLFGRKTGEGFYRYVDGAKQEAPETPIPSVAPRPVWVHDADALRNLLPNAETGARPTSEAIVLVAPYGQSALDYAHANGLPAERTLAVDPLGDFAGRLTLSVHPGVDPSVGQAALATLAATGRSVTVVRDTPAPVAQRLLASVVNVASAIAEQRLARPQDINTAVRLGLGYPYGPLEWGDRVGASTILRILRGMHDATGDPRYRPSLWLSERAALGLPLSELGTAPTDLFR
jgi:3-hydroxybutyryl-CoA dehydrogenase